MSSFSQVYESGNILRAYRWVLSNPDPRYKNYFRSEYAAYALATDLNLRILARQIRSGRFSPSYASKIYYPKPSGLLRQISLLTVNDQIAYQASINLIAEAIHRRTTKRHGSTVFYHLYAGKSSPFFYRKWERSYAAYANAIRDQFKRGLHYVATFDLTAFYDTIDHHVLRVFLQRSGIDPDAIDFLLNNLRHWTEATWSGGSRPPIHHGHGIPQGPAASGMLSEVVLQHLDVVGDRKSKDIQYLRYVDDIKIMARDEKALRRKIVALDLASKEVGLFPQGSKISIRKISDPEEEIKSISVPPEPAAAPMASQKLVQSRLRLYMNRSHVTNVTRFKYLLPRLKPTATTNKKIVKLFQSEPHLADTVARHFSKYRSLPSSLRKTIISLALDEGVYHSVNAELLNLLYGRVAASAQNTLADFAYERLFAKRYRTKAIPAPQATYRASLIKWALLSNRMTYLDIQTLIQNERDWWVRQDHVANLDQIRLGRPSYDALLNIAMRTSDPEPARVAAAALFDVSGVVAPPTDQCHWAARLLLRNVGLLAYAGRPPSQIPGVLNYVIKFSTFYNWQLFFGSAHDAGERLAIVAKQRFETDIDAFVVNLDSFCDLLTRKIFEHRGHVMRTTYGNAIGAGASAWFRADFPALMHGFAALHQLRIRSFTAHPRHSTGALNRRITHWQFYRVRKDVLLAFQELGRQLPMP